MPIDIRKMKIGKYNKLKKNYEVTTELLDAVRKYIQIKKDNLHRRNITLQIDLYNLLGQLDTNTRGLEQQLQTMKEKLQDMKIYVD